MKEWWKSAGWHKRLRTWLRYKESMSTNQFSDVDLHRAVIHLSWNFLNLERNGKEPAERVWWGHRTHYIVHRDPWEKEPQSYVSEKFSSWPLMQFREEQWVHIPPTPPLPWFMVCVLNFAKLHDSNILILFVKLFLNCRLAFLVAT